MQKGTIVPHTPRDLARDGLSPDRDPVRVFLAGLQSKKSQQTMLEGLNRIAAILNVPLDRIPFADARLDFAYTEAIRAKLIAKYQPATVQVTLAALRGVLRTSWRLGCIDHETFARATDWPALRASRLPAGRDLSDDEIARLRAYCAAAISPYGPMLTAIFAILIGSGLRADELCRLTVDSVNLEGGELRIVRKGNKEAEIGLGRSEMTDVRDWIAVRKSLRVSVSWLFVRAMKNGRVRGVALNVKGLEYLCSIVARDAGLSPFSPHDCRRTFATRLLDAGIDLATVQRLMSHASPETTARYDKRQHRKDVEARRSVVLWGEILTKDTTVRKAER